MKSLVALMLVIGLVSFAAAQDLSPAAANADLDMPAMGVERPYDVESALDEIIARWGNGWFRGREWSIVNDAFGDVWAGLEDLRADLSPAEFAAAEGQINDAWRQVMAAGMN